MVTSAKFSFSFEILFEKDNPWVSYFPIGKRDFCIKGPILGFFDAFPELWCLLIILGVLGLSITCEQEHYAEAKTL